MMPKNRGSTIKYGPAWVVAVDHETARVTYARPCGHHETSVLLNRVPGRRPQQASPWYLDHILRYWGPGQNCIAGPCPTCCRLAGVTLREARS